MVLGGASFGKIYQGEVDALGLANIRDMVDNYRRAYGVEIFINLDHSPSVASACVSLTLNPRRLSSEGRIFPFRSAL